MSKPKLKPLDPPDYERCQAEKLFGSFMTLGPRPMIRCSNKPVIIAEESNPGEDGQKGSMSLCEECLTVFKSKYPEGYAIFRKIT